MQVQGVKILRENVIWGSNLKLLLRFMWNGDKVYENRDKYR